MANSLPFGVSGSVAGFLRVSTAVFHVLTLGLGVWTGTFFDDFPVLSMSEIAKLTMRFSKDGKKWVPFGNHMAALGVIVDTSRFGEGSVFLLHTDSRKAELNDTLDEHLSGGNMTPKEAESLRGRLIWFESFIFGRVANLSVHIIGKRALERGGNPAITAELRRALLFFKNRVVNGPPIEICPAAGEVIYIFTDGAYEENAE